MSGQTTAQPAQEPKAQAQAPAATMTEAAFSLNVKMIDKFGQEVMLTFRAPMVNQAEKLLTHYESVVDHLIKAGWETSKAGHRQAPAESSQGAPEANGTPQCRVHGAAMRESKHRAGEFFCSKKLADGSYCKEKA